MDGADLERLSPSDASCVCTGTYRLVTTGTETQSGHEDRDWNLDLDVDVDRLDHDGPLVSLPLPPGLRRHGTVQCGVTPWTGTLCRPPWTWTNGRGPGLEPGPDDPGLEPGPGRQIII